MNKEQQQSANITNDQPQFMVGDTVVVSSTIQEGERSRIQKFEGVVIAQKGSGISKTFTVRKIGANEIGVERIFPVHSPLIANIEVTREGKVRRSKLYYLRDRRGKRATYVRPKN